MIENTQALGIEVLSRFVLTAMLANTTRKCTETLEAIKKVENED